MFEHHTSAGSASGRSDEISLEQFSSILECITDAFLILDSGWRYVYMNRESERLLGRSREELLGRNIWEVYPGAVGNPFHEGCCRAMAERVTTTFEHLSSGAGKWFENWIYPYADGISVIFHDISERKEREQLRDALARVHTAINSTLDFEEMIDRVMAESMQALGMDCASVTLSEDGAWVPRHLNGVPEEIRGKRFPAEHVPLASMTSEARDVVAIEDVMKLPVTGLSLVRRIGARSAISIPLVIRDEVVGILVFSRRSGRTAFSEAQVDFARKLSSSVSLALHNARLFGGLQGELADRERLLGRMGRLVEASQSVLGARSVDELMQTIVDSARFLTGAMFSASGHGHRNGIACIGATSSDADRGPSPPPAVIAEFCGEVSQAIVEKNESVRLSPEELRRHARLCSLPNGYAPLRGLLGAPLRQADGCACGHIMVSDKSDGGEFSAEDEALLEQLAAAASLALQHLGAKEEAERRAREAEESQRTLRALMEFVPVGIAVADAPDGTIRAISEFGRDPASRGWAAKEQPAPTHLRDLSFRRADDPAGASPAELPVMQAVSNGQIVTDEEWVIADADGREVPLLVNAGPIRDESDIVTGSVVVWREISGITKTRDDLRQAFEREKHFTDVLQKALAPRSPSVGAGYNTASRYVSAYKGQRAGGDFYDVFPTAHGTVAVIIGDVSGNGFEAVALAAGTRSTVRAFAYELPSAGEALSRANTVLYPQQPWGSFVTVSLALIDPPTGRIACASAGHPPAAILRTTGVVNFQAIGCPPLGIEADMRPDEQEMMLLPGDKIVFYTDGISEARRGGSLFGTEGIERVLKEHGGLGVADLLEKLLAEAGEWANGYLKDDAAIIVVERAAEFAGGRG